MKAIVHRAYGSPDVLRLEDVPKPVPAADELLVRVRAASVNPLDWHFVRGTPYVARIAMGLRAPRQTLLGVDFAGTIESAGASVTRFARGDEVFGATAKGTLAEYVCVREDRAVARKPARVGFEEAASLPVAAITALQAIRDEGSVRPGQQVLVNGASGGVGVFAVQIAKSSGAHVTGVCSARNVELVRSLGADRVVDYAREDFTKSADRWDVLVDNVGNHPLLEVRRVLRRSGRYVMVGGPPGAWLDPLPRAVGAFALSPFVSQRMRTMFARLGQKDLTLVRDLVDTGKVKPVVDRRYALADAAEAVRYLAAGHARGKVVVVVE
ncbi:MAG TPA: NAD(P)-dependent alcohol dehydrogenase [Anaeromyxobacter sp.]|nr:NAD(P)-dependent alcohol dehydrogenase [Anaeromyxobacter sp.]